MRTDTLIKLGKEIITVLKELKEIKAIAFYGAIASGYADEYSDLDIICFCYKIPPPNKRKKVLLKLSNKVLRVDADPSSQPDLMTYKGEESGISYKDINKYDLQIKELERRGRLDRSDAEIVTHIYNAKTVWDPDEIITNRKKIIYKYVENLPKSVNFLLQILKDFTKEGWPYGAGIEQAIKRKNYIWINQLLQWHFDITLLCLYALNKMYYSYPISKWSYKQIEGFKIKPKNCVRRLEQIALLGNDSSSLEKKLKLMKSLINDLGKLSSP